MTREEAQIIIGNIPIDGQDECYSIAEYQEAKTMAIKALEQEPKIVPIAEIKFDDDMLHEIVEEAVKNIEIEPKWIPISERLPNKGQWVLITTEEYQKPIEIMCYQGIRIGKHDNGNGWEEYEYPSWTSGHGDIQGYNPKAWMPLPAPYEVQEKSE